MKQLLIIALSLILFTSCNKADNFTLTESVPVSPSCEVQPEPHTVDSIPTPSDDVTIAAPKIPNIKEPTAGTEIPSVPETGDSEKPLSSDEEIPKSEPTSEPLYDTPDFLSSSQPPTTANEVEKEPVYSESEPPVETKSVSMEVFGLNKEIIFSATAEHREGITVFDLLTEQAREKNIPVVFSGGKSSTYVTSINGLSEKANGPESGWIYTVNNKMVMKSCSKYILSPDDTVQWTYITKFTVIN